MSERHAHRPEIAPPDSAPADPAPPDGAPDWRRPNRVVFDLQVIGDNVAALRRLIGPAVRFFATVKADAYGFGLVPVAKTVLAAGADALSVVRLEDALALRAAGIRAPILLYAGNLFDPARVAAIEAADLWPSLHDLHGLRALRSTLRRPIGCGIKIESGQERLGVPAEAAGDFARELAASGRLRLELVHTHPHVVDAAPDHLRWQFDRFIGACDAIDTVLDSAAAQHPRRLRIFAGTRVLALRRDMMLSAVDPGQALFRLPSAAGAGGLAQPPSPASMPRGSPTPLHALTSRLIHVFDVRRSEFTGQLPVAVAPGARIGIVPIGYGDGLAKLHAGQVLVRGQRARLLSPLSVEYTRIDLSDCPQAEVGDEVVLIGTQGAHTISPDEVMRHTGVGRVTDLVIPIGPGIPRDYLPWKRPDAGSPAPASRSAAID